MQCHDPRPPKISATYTLGTIRITQVESVSDLGVAIDSKLKFKNHIRNMVSRANQRKSLTLRCFLSRNPSNLSSAFRIYIRSLLDSSTIWSPSYISEIIHIESVQRDFTKRIPGCAHLSYPERLSETAKSRTQTTHRRPHHDFQYYYRT